MCGIAGFVTFLPAADRKCLLERMLGKLIHRGPDGHGELLDEHVTLGMRRLSIVDVEGGNQPLTDETGDIVLVYNGEIYNSPALRAGLESRGHRFRSGSDGEVICHLYEEIGDDAFSRLDGMFAAALWSRKEKRLILARDIPGEKPLYYTTPAGGGLAFASEIKSLREFPGVDRTLDLQALWDLPTFLWIPEPATIHPSVKALPPGHLLVHDAAGQHVRAYPNRFRTSPGTLPDADAIEETRRIVEASVKSRLLSDVRVGSFLSGGLDSSIVATIAARERDTLATFTVAFEEVADPYGGQADESVEAMEHAHRIGSEHHTIRVNAGTFRETLDAFTYHGDMPWAVSSGLGILAVAGAARDLGIKVLLSGDGADESFGGYAWYSQLARRPGPATSNPGGIVSFQSVGMDVDQRAAIVAGFPPDRRAWAWHYYAAEEDKRRLFHPDVAHSIKSSLRHFDVPDCAWEPDDFIAHDRRFYLPFEMLRKLDRMTMAQSVEGRTPFTAPAVLSLADQLTYQQRVRNDTLKWCLREAFRPLLPDEILSRPKHGFNVPIDRWLKGEWSDLLDECFSSTSCLSRHGLIHSDSREVAAQLLADPVRLSGHTLLSFIVLDRWLARFS